MRLPPSLLQAGLKLFVLSAFACGGLQPLAAARQSDGTTGLQHIEQVDIIALSHLDVGFTDLPSTVRELQRRYIDVAVDLCLATKQRPREERYYWTVESQLPLWDWWQAANAARRRSLLGCVRTGQIDVGAFAFNQQPYLSAADWHTMSNWLPDTLWNALKPGIGLQDDVNGMPRKGVEELLDRGVHRLWMGMNGDGGGPPIAAPAPFWWKMPDGRRIFTYLANGYFEGQVDLREREWRHGPTPRAYDLQYRPPGRDDVLATSPDALRASQKQLLAALKRAEQHGYNASRYIISFSNEWRGDNDPPFADIPRFVAAWNKAGLKPHLRFTTASQAVADLEHEYGAQAPEYTGEWTDWWADGEASDPRVVAAGREAERTLRSIASPFWHPQPAGPDPRITDLRRQLTLFSEHTWGSSWSIAFPHGYDSEAQYAEKVLLAYRPAEISKWLLSQQARVQLREQPAGLTVVNTSDLPWSGWVNLQVEALRDKVHSLRDRASGETLSLDYSPGIRVRWPDGPAQVSPQDDYRVFPDRYPDSAARFWVHDLPANASRNYDLLPQQALPAARVQAPGPVLQKDSFGWPTSATWPGQTKPLFVGSLGGFESISVEGDTPRQSAIRMAAARAGTELTKLRTSTLVNKQAAEAAPIEFHETAHTLVFRQALTHPRLHWYERELVIWKDQPRAQLTIRLSRIPSSAAEAYFVSTDLPETSALPKISSGGMPFTPFAEQFPGSCMDYFAFDGWATYTGMDGEWLWFSRDAPVVSFGDAELFSHLVAAPEHTNRIRSMVFNNTWYVNWVADSSGEMTFRYDLVWNKHHTEDVERLAANLWLSPVVFSTSGNQDRIVDADLFRR